MAFTWITCPLKLYSSAVKHREARMHSSTVRSTYYACMHEIIPPLCVYEAEYLKGDIRLLVVLLRKCHQVSGGLSCSGAMLLWHHTWPAKKPHTPMMQRMLKTAEPTMVPTPTSPLVMNTPRERARQHINTHSLLDDVLYTTWHMQLQAQHLQCWQTDITELSKHHGCGDLSLTHTHGCTPTHMWRKKRRKSYLVHGLREFYYICIYVKYIHKIKW